MRTRLFAEALGTFWLVLGGCGTAIIAAAPHTGLGVGPLGVALAFGLTVLTGAYALGPLSGAHFNPAVTFGLMLAGRFERRNVVPYMVAQVGGAIAAALVIYLVARGAPGFSTAAGFAANGYGVHSPAGYGLGSALLAEVVLTAVFVFVILAVTHVTALENFAPLPIGLTLTLVHLVGIPVTNVSVNPARSTGPALFAGGWALGQLWLFWLAPLVGAAAAAWVYREFVVGRVAPAADRTEPRVARPPRARDDEQPRL